jgi:ABC-2 type transport system permease protein
MIDRKQFFGSLLITLALVALNLVAFNALLSHWSAARIDLTEDRLYSISPATKRIISSLDEDVTILGLFSRRSHPKLAPLVPQIEDMLEEYGALSRGRVKIEIVDPGEDEQVEQEAVNRYGVSSTPFRLASKYETGIVNAYFAVVVRYADQYVRYGFDDLIEVEPLPDGDVDVRLRNLEYDLTRAIKKVVYGFRSTAELFERVDERVRFTLVQTSDGMPELFDDVVEAVRVAAGELEEKGGDKFEFEEIDPGRDEALQNEVYQRFGARPMSLGLFSEGQFYLYGYLEGGGLLEQLDLTGEGISAATVREAIEDSLRRQTPGFLKTVGIVAPDPSLPPEVLMQLQMQGQRVPQPPPEFEQIRLFLGRDYQVRNVDLSSNVPTEVDTLLLLKPSNLDESAVYNLDQYLMRGGRVIVCAARYAPQFDQNTGLQAVPVTSGLDDWLAHFGIEIPETLVLDDRNQPLPIPEYQRTPLGLIQTLRMEPYPYLVEVRDEGLINREVTARLDAVGIYWGSPVLVDRERASDLEVIEILRSSSRSWTSDDLSQVSRVDYQVPEEGTESRMLAVSLSGKFSSYFTDREPPAPADAGGEDSDEGQAATPADVVLEKSPETRVVVIGNAAFVSDLVARALALDGGFFGANLAFMQNVIDWVNLDNEMLGIRSRGTGVRRLARTERGTQVMIEVVNYLIPVLALLAWGAHRMWRRRHATPIVTTSATTPARAPRRAEG